MAKTRMEVLRERGEEPALPVNPAPHLTDWLLEIGPTGSVGMGELPIGWETLAAWQQLTGIELDPWEARTLRRLSRAFAAQRHDARKPSCEAPWTLSAPTEVEVNERVSIQFKAMFAAMRKPAAASPHPSPRPSTAAASKRKAK